jgi:dGTPase
VKLTLAEERERDEEKLLSEYAIKSVAAIRDKPVEKNPYRTEFQRDRDRILYSKYFRLLMHKTQVMPSPEFTYVRTRLTHTLEVSQIARTIARGLKLNEDLTEAIALGHDLGHPPFGHAGEVALRDAMQRYGFEHNEQSLRIVENLEDLNLTKQVREGILRHTSPDENYYSSNGFTRNLTDLKQRFGYPNERPSFLETQVVDVADEIAYLTHDLEDLLFVKLIKISDIPQKWKALFGEERKTAIDCLVTNVIEHANKTLAKGIIDELSLPIIYDKKMVSSVRELKKMLNKIFEKPPLGPKEKEAQHYIKLLFDYWKTNPNNEVQQSFAAKHGARIEVSVCDYIVQLTDQEIIRAYEGLFSPRTSSNPSYSDF